MALTHFDAHGCFEDESWDALIEAFRTGTWTSASSQDSERWRRCRHSRYVTCDVDGVRVPLALMLSAFQFQGGFRNPSEGIVFGLDVKGLGSYFQEEVLPGSTRRSLQERRRDSLRVACVLRCGDAERSYGCVLEYDERRNVATESDTRYFWHFTPLRNLGLALSIEVKPGSDGTSGEGADAFFIDEGISNAQWNLALPGGTDFVPLVTDLSNEFAALPYAAGVFECCVVLVRRGGGCGFAQKALAARNAGAVGCIIYECQGDREAMGYVRTMGRHFGGVDHPDPGIPCLLVSAADTNRLLAAAASPGGALARVGLERAEAVRRRIPASFEAFRRCVMRGEPLHVAVLVERVTRPDDAGDARVSWFEDRIARSTAEYMFDRGNRSWVEIGIIEVHLHENADEP